MILNKFTNKKKLGYILKYYSEKMKQIVVKRNRILFRTKRYLILLFKRFNLHYTLFYFIKGI